MLAFSGGKNLRGAPVRRFAPREKGAHRRSLCEQRTAQPFRADCEGGEEEIVGLLRAVEVYVNERDHKAEREEHHAMLERARDRLEGLPTVVTEYATNDDYSHSPRLTVQRDESALGLTLEDVMTELRDGEPGIIATNMERYRPAWKGVGIFPYNLQPVKKSLSPTGSGRSSGGARKERRYESTGVSRDLDGWWAAARRKRGPGRTTDPTPAGLVGREGSVVRRRGDHRAQALGKAPRG